MLYDRVKQLCASSGTTITELERDLKLGNGTIHNWNKSDPSVKKVMAVAEHFGIGLQDLVSGTNAPSKESQEMAARFDGYSENQKNLIRCYMSLIETGKAG